MPRPVVHPDIVRVCAPRRRQDACEQTVLPGFPHGDRKDDFSGFLRFLRQGNALAARGLAVGNHGKRAADCGIFGFQDRIPCTEGDIPVQQGPQVGHSDLHGARSEVPEVAPFDPHVPASVGQFDGVFPKLAEGTVAKQCRAQPFCGKSGIQKHVPLPVHAVVAVQIGIHVPEREVLESQMLHPLAVRHVAVECDQPGGQHRRHDLDGSGIFAGKRIVVERPAFSVQVPLARHIQSLEDIHDVVSEVTLPEVHRPAVGTVEPHHTPVREHLLDPVDRGRPGTEKDHVGIGQPAPAGIDVPRVVPEGPALVFAGGPPLGPEQLFTPIRHPGTLPGTTVHAQRVEHPPFAHGRHIELEKRLARHRLPLALQPAPAAEDSRFPGKRPVRHRRTLTAAVFRSKDQGFRQHVRPPPEKNRQRSGYPTVRPQLTHPAHGARNRGKRLVLRACRSVVAVRRHVQ
mgnify:CR=1 FL=1